MCIKESQPSVSEVVIPSPWRSNGSAGVRVVTAVMSCDFRRTVRAPDFQSGGAGFQTRENALFPDDRAFSPGENGPELSNQPLGLFLPRALMLCIRARLYSLRKNSCF